MDLDVKTWQMEKARVMFEIVLGKFGVPALAQLLERTWNKIIVEAAYYDKIFGIGLQTGDFVIRGEVNRKKICDKYQEQSAELRLSLCMVL